MKNVLQYYYKMNPQKIHQVNNDYRCIVNGELYLLRKLQETNADLKKIHILCNYLLQNGIPCYKIIPNFHHELVTVIGNEPYILLQIFESNRFEEFDDIKLFSKIYIDKEQYKELDRSNWYQLWTKKIDYIEYQVGQFGKNYPHIRSSINYYIGLAENAVSLISNISGSYYLTVSHKRIKIKNRISDIYDPLNFVLDNRVRDLSEFYKEKFFNGSRSLNELKQSIFNYKMNSYEALMFFARMLFPTYYFDCYQQVVLGDLEEKEILKYIQDVNNYQFFLKDLYFFLRQYYEIPEIEWIIKT